MNHYNVPASYLAKRFPVSGKDNTEKYSQYFIHRDTCICGREQKRMGVLYESTLKDGTVKIWCEAFATRV